MANMNEKKLREIIKKIIVGELKQEAFKPEAKVYKPGDKIRIKKYNNFDKKKETINGKVESIKNGVIKYTYSNFAGQQWGEIKVGDTNIVETSASGNAGPYMTPKAFTKPGQDYEGSPAANAMPDWTKTKRIDETISFKNGDKVRFDDTNERGFFVKSSGIIKNSKNNYYEIKKANGETVRVDKHAVVKYDNIDEQVDFKDDNFSPKQKMAQAIRTVRESLKEVEKIVDKSRVFKEENNIKSVDMYKRSHQALRKIGEQMNRIANKMQAIK
jgi:hypothetical protein